ncbi:MAG: DUF1508 domain-containing protein [Candidatus Bathyarchaeota archaeon]
MIETRARKDSADEHRSMLQAPNGEIILVSEGYTHA